METIRVNMTPCEDIKTIHASQNDNEGREWGFELHNNGELIDTSDVTDQIVFKAYKGGTEQILPENTSTPTTSPFKGDIRYPQGLLSDQEFLYRESPTESDGLAKITDIKGNTLVWNQLVNNGNFASATGWKTINTSISVANNKATVTINGNGAVIYNEDIYFQKSHKILLMLKTDNTSACSIRMYSSAWAEVWYKTMNRVGNMQYSFIEPTDNTKIMYVYLNRQTGDVVTVENIQAFDLTQMGLDISNPSDFTSLFSLPYYAYNQGTLLSFMGNGIKTVGFNQWDGETESGYIYNGITYASNDYWRTKNYIHVIPNETYYFNVPSTQGQIALYDANKVYVSSVNSMGGSSHLVTIPSGCYFARFYQPVSSDSSTVCVNISSSRNGQYEPYTSSTLSLPISTYFPTGMKSAGSVYDELTDTKAITRIGAVNLGSLTWAYSTQGFFLSTIDDIVQGMSSSTVSPNVISDMYAYKGASGWASMPNMSYGFNNTEIRIKNTAYNTADDFKTAMNGVYLYFELATESETSFSTASLVTENAEIPLSNEDGVLIGKCTEQLSSESGFFDAKIKLAEADGECYSNKLQLHVERKPS